jgi:acetoin utilization protein AcuC
VSGSVALVYSPHVVSYDHGPQHPLRPVRVKLTRELIAAYGMLDGGSVEELAPPVATDDELRLVHTRAYIDAVRRAGAGEPGEWWRYGFGPGDNPIFPDMHEASARVAGGSILAARVLVEGRFDHAFNPAGGLHHAMPDRASGFCVYDDPALAIAWLLEHGVERVAYVDVDVHHGDGPQAVFYGDSRVLTISLHESGRYLFPGTGFTDERGAGEAEGTKVNVPLPPYTSDGAWRAAFREVVPPLVEGWKPDVLVTQLGCDTHHTDPLAHLALSTTAYRETATDFHELAHRAAGGRWLATGGGGYQWARVVPRAWTIYFAEMAERRVPDEIPSSWLELARGESSAPVPDRLSEEGPDRRPDVTAEVERVLAAVRASSLPRPNDPTS